MGRMADARKKAKEKKGEGGTDNPPPSSSEGASFAEPPAPARPESPPPAAEELPRWISREETLTFPADIPAAPAPPVPPPPVPAPPPAPSPAPSTSGGRIALPSSGLASDILAREDAKIMEPASFSDEPDAGEISAPVAALQNVSFFGPQSRDERKITVEPMEHLVTFLLAEEEYGLDVRVVQEIIRLAEITHVPRSPGFIKGVINLRGRIIPVVDLKRKLELGQVDPSRLARIVVVKLRERLIGLLVDGASQVLKIPVSSVDAAPEEILDVNVSFIRGVAKLQSRLIILLDLQKILAVEIEHAAVQ